VALAVVSGFLEICILPSCTPSTHNMNASKGQICLHDLFSAPSDRESTTIARRIGKKR